ncbi:MAG: discoidin domain-containing protein [Clostridia bacterium]|nr:discoidin domain-containing protein [Clostridia bacterium]
MPGSKAYDNMFIPMVKKFSPNGFKAVLYHQGETDSQKKTTASAYANQLQTLIQNTRDDAGWNVPWMIANISIHVNTVRAAQNPILLAQQHVIAQDTNVYNGPYTDDMPNDTQYRHDNIHFNETGLKIHGTRWGQAICREFYGLEEDRLELTINGTALQKGQAVSFTAKAYNQDGSANKNTIEILSDHPDNVSIEILNTDAENGTVSGTVTVTGDIEDAQHVRLYGKVAVTGATLPENDGITGRVLSDIYVLPVGDTGTIISSKLSGFSIYGQNVADYNSSLVASEMLDGISNDYNANFWGTKEGSTEAYVTFDAGAVIELREMHIYARPHTNTYNRFIKDYEVFVSAFAPTYGAKDGTAPTGLGEVTKSGSLSACSSSKLYDVITLPEGTEGQYITLHVKNLQGGPQVDLAEVIFYGTERDGSSVTRLAGNRITYVNQNVADYDGSAGDYPATMLLDGITDQANAGIWCTKSCTEAYITFDLGRSLKMHSLNVYARNHKNTVNRAVKDYEVYLSETAPVYYGTNGEVPTGIGSLATEGTLATFSTTQLSRTIAFPNGGEGRYLTLHVENIHGGTTLDLAEIEFFVYTSMAEKAALAVDSLAVDYLTGKLIMPTVKDCSFALSSSSNTDVLAMDGTAEILYGGNSNVVLTVTDKNGDTATTDVIPVEVLSLRHQMASPCKLTEVETGNFSATHSEINLINGIAGGTAGGGSWSERYWATEDGVQETEVLLTMAEAGNAAGITMLSREDDATKFPQEFEVLVSADGKAFTSVLTKSGCTAKAAEKQTFRFDVQQDVKFVKVVMKTAATRFEVSEMEVLTTPDLLTAAEAVADMLVTQRDKAVVFENITKQFDVEIMESGAPDVVALNGAITLPATATDVMLTLRVTNRLDTTDTLTLTRTLAVKTQAKLDVEAVAADTDLIPIPELNSNKITYPVVPEGYTIKIAESDTPAVVDADGNITRSDDTTYRVRLTFEITDTATGDTARTKALLVPIYKTYVAPTMSEEEINKIREDYKAKKYGIFIHYIPESDVIGHGTVYADGNVVQTTDELVENFDAEQFAKDVHDFGVEYVVFTVWHYQGQALFPSMTMQRWKDDRRSEGNTDYKTYAEGDLIEELLDALEPYGIDLHLYNHPAGGVSYPTEDKANVGWNDKTDNYATWNQYINELYYELGDRYGDRLKGLWLDGIFSHIPSGEPQARLRATAEMFNPAMILTMNAGFQEGNLDIYPQHNLPDNRCWEINRYVDYINDLEFARYQVATCLAAQYWWTTLPADTTYKMQPASEMFQYMVALASISEQGGLLASTGIYPVREGEELDSIWLKGMKENLTQVGGYIKPIAESIQNTAIGKAFPTTENSTVADLEWGVSTESRDGKNVYLHVLKAPTGNTLTLPETADGSVLAENAVIMNFDNTTTPVTITKTESGYTITLPEGTEWNEVDTVIKVSRGCAEIDGVSFATLEAALDAAKDGDTVKLCADVAATRLMIAGGVTLDLNGKTLTADYLVGFNGAVLMDSAEDGSGKLTIAKENLALPKNNPYLPVYDEEGGHYLFTRVKNDRFEVVADENSKPKYSTSPMFKEYVHSLMDSETEAEKSGVDVIIRLTWSDSEGQYQGVQDYTYFDDSIAQVIASYVNEDGAVNYEKQFYGIFVGSEIESGVDVSVSTVVRSSTGVEMESAKTALFTAE